MINCMRCCAIREMHGLSLRDDPKSTLLASLDELERQHQDSGNLSPFTLHFSYLLFSGVSPHEYGSNFMKFILENDLGTVIKTDPNRNPNSGRLVTIYLWTVNRDKVLGWWEANRPEKNPNIGTINGSMSNV